ncbi:MAG: hypothetical protein CL868_15380 [Cytophagaceae bacterium]|nr:hypothetical protein [Cytophagaceae bacterium]|tara:strand:+ start:4227 stop:4406 length:180 start_codon:yes stop_codon:yes gene_type:complete
MKNENLKLEDFSFEKLEERKEFTFYFSGYGCHTHHSGCGHDKGGYDCGGKDPDDGSNDA